MTKSASIYLQFNGNCEEAFNFYKEVFKTEFISILRYRDIPRQEGIVSEQENNPDKIENVGIRINSSFILMGADVPESVIPTFNTGNNFSIYLECETLEEAEDIFNNLSKDGNIPMPLQTAHWGATFGMCSDKFGINWMINCEKA